MSILGSIFSKILGHHGSEPSPTPASYTTPTPPIAGGPAPTAPPASPPPSPSAAPSPSPSSSASGQTPPAPTSTGAAAPVDVAAMLDGLAAKNPQKLDWRHSIVDMMKLIDLDSSLSSRQDLAKELHYSGDMHDSAAMNIWLHKQVMQKLAANGGKVPDDLRA